MIDSSVKNEGGSELDPKISVIIPSHNRADFVRAAVMSVLAQTQVRLDVVVVDDYSTDNTREVLSDLPRNVRVVHTSENVERGAARNLGVRSSVAPLLAFLDSDDLWLPGKLERQLPFVKSGRAVAAGVALVDASCRPTGRAYNPPRSAEDRLPYDNPYYGSPSTLLVTRDDYELAGGFPEERELQGSEDWVFLSRLAQSGCRIDVIQEPLSLIRMHAENSTNDPKLVERSMSRAVEIISGDRDLSPRDARRAAARVAGIAGRKHALDGRSLRAYKMMWNGIVRGGVHGILAAGSVWLTWLTGRSFTFPALPRWWPDHSGWRRESGTVPHGYGHASGNTVQGAGLKGFL